MDLTPNRNFQQERSPRDLELSAIRNYGMTLTPNDHADTTDNKPNQLSHVSAYEAFGRKDNQTPKMTSLNAVTSSIGITPASMLSPKETTTNTTQKYFKDLADRNSYTDKKQ